MKLKNVMFLMSAMLILTLNSFGQTQKTNIYPVVNGEIVYMSVVNVDSTKSNELYVRANEWFVNTFKSAKDVIQLNDKEAGKIIGKGFFSTGLFTIHFTIEIQTKDGKYKYAFSNFICKSMEGSHYENTCNLEEWLNSKKVRKIDENINANVLNLISDLQKSMNTNKNAW
jgi:hypothetical protein